MIGDPEVVTMEDKIKSSLIAFGFRRSLRYRSTWVKQITEISDYWNYMMTDVKLSELMDEFELVCARSGQECDPWDIVTHLKKAVTDWRIELMTSVANQIAQFWGDEIDGEFVQWNGDEMLLINKPAYNQIC